jgi:DNA mismatch repair protein MutH
MQNVKELLQSCQSISGMTIKELSNALNFKSSNFFRNKGWVGQLIESYLGVTSGNLPIADFPHLGIELKTIPINLKYLTPVESTYICTAPLNRVRVCWEESVVKKKLSKILWIPIESSVHLDLIDRRIGDAFLWEPNKQQERILARDWQELTEAIETGHLENLSAKYGQYLQIRPKAADCKHKLIKYVTNESEVIKTVNRGFYLRARFTKIILREAFGIKK